MNLFLRSIKHPDKKMALNDAALSSIALRLAGDNGMTVKGTARAMAWQEQVRMLKPGGTISAGASHDLYVEKESDSDS